MSIINKCAEALNESTKKEWTRGDFDAWITYAKMMRTTILSVTPILTEYDDEISKLTKLIEEKDAIINKLLMTLATATNNK